MTTTIIYVGADDVIAFGFSRGRSTTLNCIYRYYKYIRGICFQIGGEGGIIDET